MISAKAIIKAYGNSHSSPTVQRVILMLSHQIFVERSRVRGDLWAGASVESHLNMAEEKLKRIRRNLHGLEEPIDIDVLLDDALDTINFVVFLIREVLGLKPNGS